MGIGRVERDRGLGREVTLRRRRDGVWESIRVQTDSGPVGAEGPMEIAKAFETKETVVSKKGAGHIAASGSNVRK